LRSRVLCVYNTILRKNTLNAFALPAQENNNLAVEMQRAATKKAVFVFGGGSASGGDTFRVKVERQS
jgi:hypothetical protein